MALASSTSISLSSTANAHGLHDSIRHGGVRSIASEVAPQHPLQSRLSNWEQTRENLHMTLERNMFGLHAPVRQMMERQLVAQSPTPIHVGSGGFTRPSNLGLDILMNRDDELSPGDVLIDRVESAQLQDFHVAMEHKLRLP
ncbi:hypothetical protein JCM11491_005757 [Sporobolomyces phaffii]